MQWPQSISINQPHHVPHGKKQWIENKLYRKRQKIKKGMLWVNILD